MKKFLAGLLIVMLVVVLVMASCAESETETGPIELKVSTYMSETSSFTVGIKTAFDQIEQQTEGRVKFVWFYSGALLAGDQTLTGIITGAADIGVTQWSFTPGRFPLTECIALPPTFSTSEERMVDWLFFKEYLEEEEWSEVKVLGLNPIPASDILTTVPVRTPDDMKGLRITCSPGMNTKVVQSWGATPQSLPYGEMYESIQRGIVDGVYASAYALKSLKWGEVVNYSVEAGTNSEPAIVIMNLETYKSLPKDIRKLFDEEVPDMIMQETAKITDDLIEAGRQFLIEQGGEVIQLTPAEKAIFRKIAIESVNDEWAQELEAKGLEGEKILQKRYDFLKEYMPDVFE